MSARASDFTIELGPGIRISARRLWVENLLITANSGGGKSVAGRQLMEQAAAHCAMVVFDNKGEFWSLREAIDVILVGRKGELPIDVAIAADLARFVRANGCRVVIDLSGVDDETKQAFVATFVSALLGLPDELWRVPLLVYVSEAQLLAPEEGRPVSRKAIRDLATLGRQQRICTVIDTQRLAEVAKAVIGSVTNNMMIGRLSSDVDLARATNAMGYGGRNGKELAAQMRRFDPGWFLCSGQAFDPDGTVDDEGQLVPVRTNPKTRTRHVDPAEDFDLVPPPPSASVRSLVAALAKLATEHASSSEPQSSGRSGKRTGPALAPVAVDSDAIARARHEGYDEGYIRGSADARARAESALADLIEEVRQQLIALSGEPMTGMLAAQLATLTEAFPAGGAPIDHSRRTAIQQRVAARSRRSPRARVSAPESPKLERSKVRPTAPLDDSGAPERILMVALAHPGRVSKDRVAVLARVSTRKSTLRNALTKLRGRGDIVSHGDEIEATAKARREHPSVPALPTGRALLEFWRDELGDGAPRQLFDCFVLFDGPIDAAKLAELSGVRNDRSTMRNALTKLRRLGLITKGRPPQLNPELRVAIGKKARAA